MIILKATGIKKIYSGTHQYAPTTALNHIDMELTKGSFTAIMGPSGSGKSTLLNILCGMSEPTSGEVMINDQVLQRMSKNELALFRRRHLGFVFQDYNLLDGFSVKENIMLPRILEKDSVAAMNEKADTLLKLFSLEDIADKYPHTISGGQQQRCAIARALMNRADILFADEPTGNLDSKSAGIVMRAFEKANSENNSSILMVTHDPLIASYSHRVIFIKDGLIEAEVYRKDNQKSFFHEIMDYLTALEGESRAV